MVFTALRGFPDDMPLATATLRSDALDVTTASRVLGTTPDMAAAVGGPMFRRKDGSYSEAATGVWQVTTAGRVSSSVPAEHLAWVVYRIGREVGRLQGLWPDLQVAFSLLILDDHFAVNMLPARILWRARLSGEVVIEAPNAGVDLVLQPTRTDVPEAPSLLTAPS